ncbi:MAG: rRNA maturation RNase YbeY [Cyclobacteriaceae bacterium]|nr:rRNA maturation RNase YbeY [Cyclobacteriaceae bacterium]
MAIRFFTEDVPFTLKGKRILSRWIKNVITKANKKAGAINFILCSDDYLLEINQAYLQHDTYTDIITFDHSEDPETIEGDIYISIDRIRENASLLNVTLKEELHRVLIHGILHLAGYSDKTPEQKKVMRQKEDECLELLEP